MDNYALQAQSAQKRFLTYDQQEIISRCRIRFDEAYFYPVMLGRTYRLCRRTGVLQRQDAGAWCDANTFNELLTLLDWLCDSRPERHLTGRWVQMQNFGKLFHTALLEKERDPQAEAFDRDPARLHRACRALGGTPLPGGDVSYAFELYDGLAIGLQFWHGDEDFPPCLRWFWDENAAQYLRYETMYYALELLRDLLLREFMLQ